MAEDYRNDQDLINTLVELGLLREFRQLGEILNENKELLKVKDKDNNTLYNILKELNIPEIDQILNIIQPHENKSIHLKEESISVMEDSDADWSRVENDQKGNSNRVSMEISVFPKENEGKEVALKNINVEVVEKPRFAVSHMLKKKTIIEDSRDDEYNMFSFVDENGLKHFKSIFSSFLRVKLKERGDFIYTSLVNKEQDMIKREINTLKQCHDTLTPFFNEISKDCKVNKSKCCLNLFSSKKTTKLENTYDFQKQLTAISDEINSIDSQDDKAFTIRKKDNFLLMLNDQVEMKVEEVLRETSTHNKLKDEVDKYADYFNASKYVEKQRKKLETQKVNMNLCEDSKNLKDCIICMDQERSTLFYPCLHLIVCKDCAETNVKLECPECHKAIDSKAQLSL